MPQQEQAAVIRPGDTLKVQVVGFEDNGTLIRLPDGTVTSAKGDLPTNIKSGDFVNIRVADITGDKILIELLNNNSTGAKDLLDILSHLKLPKTDANLDIVRSLILSGREVNRQTVQLVGRVMAEAVTSADKAVFMLSNNMEINSGSVNMLDAFAAHRDYTDIGGGFARILSALESAADDMIVPTQGDNAQAAEQQPVQAEQSLQIQSTQTQPTIAQQSQGGEVLQLELANAELNAVEIPQEQSQAIPREQSSPQQITQQPQVEASAQAAPEQSQAAAQQLSATADPIAATSPQQQSAQAQATAAPTQGEAAAEALPQTTVQSPEQSQPQTNTVTREQLVHTIKQQIQSLFKNAESPDLASEIRAQNLNREIESTISLLKENLPMLPREVRTVAETALRNIETSLTFMRELNNAATFMQIPITINNSKSTMELYVMNNGKGKKRIDPQNATLYLNLATSSMGDVEGYVRVINKSVDVEFGIASKEITDFFKLNTKHMQQLLEGYGYKLIRMSFNKSIGKKDIIEVSQDFERRLTASSIDIRV